MKRFLKYHWILLLLALGVARAPAFSLLGPFASWQDATMHYQENAQIGGPMNIGEEYRWNVPNIYYAYDPSFLNYFGDQGVIAVEKAVAILNNLPPMSSLSRDLHEFPLNTSRVNYQAAALKLYDLKSIALHFLLEEMGVAAPELFVYCLRNHYDSPPRQPEVVVIMRNFDPDTFQPTPYINGALFTFSTTHLFQPTHVVLCTPQLVDPLAFGYTPVATYTGVANFGLYYTGLTRDDVGALRYLYRASNVNIEGVLNNVTNGVGGGGAWTPIPGTNAATATNAVVNLSTNALPRLGVDKVHFIRLSELERQQLSIFQQPITNNFSASIVTNGSVQSVAYQRVIVQPDILFDAGNFELTVVGRTIATAWVNNSATNSAAGTAGSGVELTGPGIITPPMEITLSKMGPQYDVIQGNYFMTDTNQLRTFLWGSYDGSTNPPIVFPSGLSIRSLEQSLLQSDISGAWQPSP